MRKNGFITFVCALVPGCGQMYQGYMKRGVSLLFWFGLSCGLIAVTRIAGLGFLPVVVYIYSFFDTFNLRNLSIEQRAAFQDAFIPNPSWLNNSDYEHFKGNLRFSKIAGWSLIIIGILTLGRNFYDVLIRLLYNIDDRLGYWVDFAGSAVVGLAIGAAIILIGLRILRGPKKDKNEAEAPEELNEYKGEKDDD